MPVLFEFLLLRGEDVLYLLEPLPVMLVLLLEGGHVFGIESIGFSFEEFIRVGQELVPAQLECFAFLRRLLLEVVEE